MRMNDLKKGERNNSSKGFGDLEGHLVQDDAHERSTGVQIIDEASRILCQLGGAQA